MTRSINPAIAPLKALLVAGASALEIKLSDTDKRFNIVEIARRFEKSGGPEV